MVHLVSSCDAASPSQDVRIMCDYTLVFAEHILFDLLFADFSEAK